MDYERTLQNATPAALTGSVVEVVGLTATAADFPAPVGALAEITSPSGDAIEAEVVGFSDAGAVLYPLKSIAGVRRGCRVRLKRTQRQIRVGANLLGRVVNAHARCIDGKPHPFLTDRTPLERDAPEPIDRPRILQPLSTGVRSIDGMLTCGRGQRLGIFAGSGVGKSVLLGMMAQHTAADVNVICLVGERGREVNDFIERDLGPHGLAKSIVVVATSNEPALMRLQAASAATAIAEWFRDQGKDVLLLVDSVTRTAMANREIGLAAGEPPTNRGYPPSTFSLLPRLVERAGRNKLGSITAFYSVLVEGDDENEPIADTMRGLLDGHVWLSRKLAGEGHYPAIDLLQSISRLMSEVAGKQEQQSAIALRRLLAAYRENEDLITIGAYRKGSNRTVDAALALRDEINGFLRQTRDEHSPLETTIQALNALGARAAAALGTQPTPVAPIVTTAAPIAAPTTTV
ncbi:putative ATP synthase YscN [Posidoniimonas polymericola]|uniref:Putative ATP synthase YscN n=1 Tax=Posidoniimonas polymericola TaxID=2528002 RepID=A0A5C5YQU0_9BACT|nr:FliI/YscN family ATPase [Posidoniimonas polymericola]TWT77219.1 putative ATP synthase YscN [Posidoniimonas polymericola]